MLYLGCHLSSIGANTFQFFTRNPRGGAAKSADPADAATLVQMQRDGRLGPLVAHAPYTLNPCSKDERTREFAREVFADDLLRMELTPGNFYNFHPGSHVGQGYLGLETFRRILHHPALQGLPMILETPNELPGYAEELALLRTLGESLN